MLKDTTRCFQWRSNLGPLASDSNALPLRLHSSNTSIRHYFGKGSKLYSLYLLYTKYYRYRLQIYYLMTLSLILIWITVIVFSKVSYCKAEADWLSSQRTVDGKKVTGKKVTEIKSRKKSHRKKSHRKKSHKNKRLKENTYNLLIHEVG